MMKINFNYPDYFTDTQKRALDTLRTAMKPYHALYLLIDEINAPYDVLVAFSDKISRDAAMDAIDTFNHEQFKTSAKTFLVSYLLENESDVRGRAYEC